MGAFMAVRFLRGKDALGVVEYYSPTVRSPQRKASAAQTNPAFFHLISAPPVRRMSLPSGRLHFPRKELTTMSTSLAAPPRATATLRRSPIPALRKLSVE